MPAPPDAPSVPRSSERLGGIELLRGIAALMVVFWHAVNRTQWSATGSAVLGGLLPILHYGILGVPLFFVISGYCIHLRWAKEKAKGLSPAISFGAFWRRRFWRLYPPYFFALLITMAIVVARWLLGRSIDFPVSYAPPVGQRLAIDLGLHLTMLHGLHPFYDWAGGNSAYWTLAREEYLYSLYFVLLALRTRFSAKRIVLAVFVFGLLVPAVAAPLLDSTAGADRASVLRYALNDHNSAIALWIQWVLGALAVEAHFGLASLPGWARRGWLAIVWGLLAAAASHVGLAVLEPALWGLTFFTVVNATAAQGEPMGSVGRVLYTRLRAVGVFSYSLYLIHIPAIIVLQKSELLARSFLGIPSAVSATAAYQLLVWLAFVLGACAAGYAFHQVVEKRFLSRR
jgi:peptidoglycan/LPS O-acetylase OafA/YrhL